VAPTESTERLATARRLTARGERRRERILDAAMAVFAERGYDAASVAEIARRADISKSVIYDHFESKAGLYTALLTAQTTELAEHVEAAIPQPGTEGRLRAAVDAYFEFVERQPAAWVMLERDPPADPELLAIHRRLHEERVETLGALLTPEPPDDPELRRRKDLFKALLATAIHGLATWWHDHPDTPREEVVDAVMAVARSGAQGVASPP
jgi:AcrR family transcriptional regulator